MTDRTPSHQPLKKFYDEHGHSFLVPPGMKPSEYKPLPFKERSRLNNIACRTREAKYRARWKTTTCQMPLCDRNVVMDDGRSLGLCITCALDVGEYFDRLGEVPELTERQFKRRMNERAQAQRLDEEATSRSMTPGWIYYLLVSDRIKIGYTVDVKRRLRSYPPDSPLLALHPGTKTLEHEMHVKFAGSRAAGREWFLDTNELRQHITEVIDQFGEPDRARYEHRGKMNSGLRAAPPKPNGLSI